MLTRSLRVLNLIVYLLTLWLMEPHLDSILGIKGTERYGLLSFPVWVIA